MRKKIIYAARTRAKKVKFEYEEKEIFLSHGFYSLFANTR